MTDAIQKAREAAWLAIFAGDPAAKAATVATIDRDDLEIAIRAYLASATPADAGEERKPTLHAKQAIREWVQHSLDNPEAAFNDVVAAAELYISDEEDWKLRATSAEAKMAEARKVIERYESGLNTLATTFYKDDQHQDYAKHVLQAAHCRFLEETK